MKYERNGSIEWDGFQCMHINIWLKHLYFNFFKTYSKHDLTNRHLTVTHSDTGKGVVGWCKGPG